MTNSMIHRFPRRYDGTSWVPVTAVDHRIPGPAGGQPIVFSGTVFPDAVEPYYHLGQILYYTGSRALCNWGAGVSNWTNPGDMFTWSGDVTRQWERRLTGPASSQSDALQRGYPIVWEPAETTLEAGFANRTLGIVTGDLRTVDLGDGSTSGDVEGGHVMAWAADSAPASGRSGIWEKVADLPEITSLERAGARGQILNAAPRAFGEYSRDEFVTFDTTNAWEVTVVGGSTWGTTVSDPMVHGAADIKTTGAGGGGSTFVHSRFRDTNATNWPEWTATTGWHLYWYRVKLVAYGTGLVTVGVGTTHVAGGYPSNGYWIANNLSSPFDFALTVYQGGVFYATEAFPTGAAAVGDLVWFGLMFNGTTMRGIILNMTTGQRSLTALMTGMTVPAGGAAVRRLWPFMRVASSTSALGSMLVDAYVVQTQAHSVCPYELDLDAWLT